MNAGFGSFMLMTLRAFSDPGHVICYQVQTLGQIWGTRQKTEESDGSWGLLNISTKDFSLSSRLSLDGRQSCQRSYDLFNLLLSWGCNNPRMGTFRPPLVRGFWGRYESPDQC